MTSITTQGDRGMNEVRCPKCKEELQFPFMICPECRWKAKGQTVLQHSQMAERYIDEHPQDRDQLLMVLDMVMKDREEEAADELKRSRKRREMGRKIKVWYIIFSGLFGTLWIWYGLAVLFASRDGTPIPVSIEICLLNIASMASLLAAFILLVLKLVSLKK